MRYGVIWVLLGIVALLGASADTARAEEASPWIVSEMVKSKELPIKEPHPDTRTCNGSVLSVERADLEGLHRACVFGDQGGERMARFEIAPGTFAYAFSFRSDVKFYMVENFCEGAHWCLYSQEEDVAIGYRSGETIIAGGFSEHLRPAGVAPLRYSLQPHSGHSIPLKVVSSALSSNGRWAVGEVQDEGVVRIDVKTGAYWWGALQTTRGFERAHAPLDLAISDDGRHMIVAGWSGGMRAYEFTEGCGYRGGVFRTYGYRNCHYHELEIKTLVPGFLHAQQIRFLPGGMNSTAIVSSQHGYRRVTFTPKSQSERAPPYYVAFGDSFTSGEGETSDLFYEPLTNTSTNRCHVSLRSYPFLMGAYWEYLTQSKACSGSRTTEVLAAIRDVSDWRSPILLSIGVGGNDIDVMGKLKTCLGVDTCLWATKEHRMATRLEIERLLPQLVAIIQELQGVTTAPLFIVGYPLVINDAPFAPCRPLIQGMLNGQERQYMNETVRYLNKVLEVAAHATDSTFVNVEDALVGERLCDISEAGMNGVRIGDDIAPIASLKNLKLIGAESFHPTPTGHVRIALRIQKELNEGWESKGCMSCTAAVTPTSYWRENEGGQAGARQLLGSFLTIEQAIPGDALAVAFPRRSFPAGAAVSFELHSEVRMLGQLRAEADGSLKGRLVVPSAPPGYHTVQAKAQSYSGEPVMLYQGIYVSGSAGEARTSMYSKETTNRATTTAAFAQTTVLGRAAARPGAPQKQVSPHSASDTPALPNLGIVGICVVVSIIGAIAILLLRRKV